ncbi:ester cyclase [Kutzneria sp. CA-103260]|uniref:ester cyclase n=1 Tax=Kutzneria sp. CA-103260 TaxID=2802641 RepID=UPI001BAB57D3|nr:ester cyclase [Kutzneria sp. CA-103260]QUQ71923.1 ester cyclase [Kutzneria sp. CA-103260]
MLLDDWIAIWNGDYTSVSRAIAPDFTVHAALMDGGSVDGPDGLVEWIKQTRAPFSELEFAVEVGPIEDGQYIVVRWLATGVYGGGFPGATAPAGAPISFTGTDILRVHDGLIAEYWINSDVHVLLGQLGVVVDSVPTAQS